MRILLLTLAGLAACDAGSSTTSVDALRLVMVAPHGDTALDQQVRRQQQAISALPAVSPKRVPLLERLGSLYVNQARTTFDDGYYTLAEQCAEAIEAEQSDSTAALLLRGLVRHNQHRFAEAAALANELVERRGNFLDFGLLGDTQLDLGAIDAAEDAYQRMLDLKPCLQSYTRAARVCWLRGDAEDSLRLLELATTAGSRRDPEPLAWCWSQLAEEQWQSGDTAAAERSLTRAFDILPGYASAQLLAGRIELGRDNPTAAVASLRQAVATKPLPEVSWALAEALQGSGDADAAAAVEADLEATGQLEDPRTLAVFLATRGRDVSRALQLAERELETRQDIYTHDAHGWALFASGQHQAAAAAIARALVHNTADPRLHYHAGVIAAATGDDSAARKHLRQAHQQRQLLLPSERRALRAHLAEL